MIGPTFFCVYQERPACEHAPESTSAWIHLAIWECWMGMLIAVVGKESVLGLVLRQARFEIFSLVRAEEPAGAGAAPRQRESRICLMR